MQKRQYGVALLLLLGLFMWPLVASADGPAPAPRQPDLVLTHDGHPQVSRAIDQWAETTGGLVVNGGFSDDPDITGTVIDGYDQRGTVKMGFTDKTTTIISKCDIKIQKYDDMAAWTHEVGHCLLGTRHFGVRGSLMQTGANASGLPNWYDLFQFALRYGSTPTTGYTLFIPMSAAE
jgi:hypothetical protein